MILIAELATNHGGKVEVAQRMIDMAAMSGANWVKTQAYDPARINPNDPQADWLRAAHLTEADHVVLKETADNCGVKYFASAFDETSAGFIAGLCGAVKFASSVDAVRTTQATLIKSYPWAISESDFIASPYIDVQMVTIPLYPTPLECVGRVTWEHALGWSDHCVGLSGCCFALAQPSICYLEVHVTTPYAARQCSWDKTPDQMVELRRMADDFYTIRSGVSQTFRDRWTA